MKPVNDSPGSIRLFETLAYPANPCIPGLIIMTNMNRSEAMGEMVVFYTDLIIQDGRAHVEEKQLHADTLKASSSTHHEAVFFIAAWIVLVTANTFC